VFDVTGSPYYSKGGDYEKFAGRDINMACAFHSTSDEHINMIMTPETRLTFSQEENIKTFFMSFC
jgi:hypothetical protein